MNPTPYAVARDIPTIIAQCPCGQVLLAPAGVSVAHAQLELDQWLLAHVVCLSRATGAEVCR